MKLSEAQELLSNGRRVAILTFKSVTDKVAGKPGKVPSVIRQLECEWGDGVCPTVNYYLRRDITSVEQAAAVDPCKFIAGQKLVCLWETHGYDQYMKNKLGMKASVAPTVLES